MKQMQRWVEAQPERSGLQNLDVPLSHFYRDNDKTASGFVSAMAAYGLRGDGATSAQKVTHPFFLIA